MKKERERRKDKEEGEKQGWAGREKENYREGVEERKRCFIKLFMVYNNKYGWLADWPKQINSLKKSNSLYGTLHAN